MGRVGRLLAVVVLLVLWCSGVAGGLGRAMALAQAEGDAADEGLPRVGDPVRFPAGVGGDAGEAGDTRSGEITVTVTQIVDPFGAFGSGTPPPGFRFVYAGLSIANGTDAPLPVDPATLFVVDTGGYAYRPSDRFGGAGGAGGAGLGQGGDGETGREDEGQDDDGAGAGAEEDETAGDGAGTGGATGEMVAPGQEIVGGAVFAVPETATLVAVYHDPAPNRLILLAVLGGDGAGETGRRDDGEDDAGEDAGDGDGDGRSGQDGSDGEDGGDGTDGADGADGQDSEDGEDGADGADGGDGGDGGDAMAVAVPDDVDCGAFAPYYADLNDRLEALNETVSGFNDLITSVASDPSGAGATIAAASGEIAALADEQARADVPPGLEGLNERAAAMFASFAAALENLATGLASFDFTAIQGVSAEIEAAGAENAAVVTAVNALAEGCGLET